MKFRLSFAVMLNGVKHLVPQRSVAGDLERKQHFTAEDIKNLYQSSVETQMY